MSGDFWLSSGYHLLDRTAEGRLLVSDDFLRAYLARPELAPLEASCAAERELHARLLERPRHPVTPVGLVRLQDPDARENYQVFARFRDHLVRHQTVEAAYLGVWAEGLQQIPPLFIDQLVHVVLRGMLEGCEDAFRLRAAECLFRTQRVSLRDGAVLLADEEVVEAARDAGSGGLEQLLTAAGASARTVELDVLNEANAAAYKARSDRFDTVLDVSFTRPGLDALCRVLERWMAHFLGLETSVQPLQRVRDERWAWHVGLDAEATAILNALYEGEEIEEARTSRLLSLFRLEMRDASLVRPQLKGRPIYLAMAQDAGARLRLKPQNLLFNLPLVTAD